MTSSFKRTGNSFVLLLAIAAVALLISLGLMRLVEPLTQVEIVDQVPTRIVSLSPAITETLIEIGAGKNLVAVSDFTTNHPMASDLPRVGTGLTPGYEAIVRLSPDIVLMQSGGQTGVADLSAVAPTKALPWMTVEDLNNSVGELGRLTGRKLQADTLLAKLSSSLSLTATADAPTVLLLIGTQEVAGGQLWYIREHSLHGAALNSAGGRNAIEARVGGTPSVSVEDLLKIDPDIIIVIDSDESVGPAEQEAFIREFSTLKTLTAVKEGRIGFVLGPNYMVTGPGLVEFTAALRGEITGMSSGRELR